MRAQKKNDDGAGWLGKRFSVRMGMLAMPDTQHHHLEPDHTKFMRKFLLQLRRWKPAKTAVLLRSTQAGSEEGRLFSQDTTMSEISSAFINCFYDQHWTDLTQVLAKLYFNTRHLHTRFFSSGLFTVCYINSK